jgi:hypothetical protein
MQDKNMVTRSKGIPILEDINNKNKMFCKVLRQKINSFKTARHSETTTKKAILFVSVRRQRQKKPDALFEAR